MPHFDRYDTPVSRGARRNARLRRCDRYELSESSPTRVEQGYSGLVASAPPGGSSSTSVLSIEDDDRLASKDILRNTASDAPVSWHGVAYGVPRSQCASAYVGQARNKHLAGETVTQKERIGSRAGEDSTQGGVP